jgi:hypothetical protein
MSASDPLRAPDGRFRAPTATERFARQAPAPGGATGDLSWLDRALAPARQRARAVDGPVTDLAPPAPVPEPQPGPGPSGPQIPAGPMGSPPTGDLIRDTIRRYHRHG